MANSILISDKEIVMQNLLDFEKNIETTQRDRVNGFMRPHSFNCDIKNQSISMEYDIHSWALNSKDIVHGGIICTMLDNASGCSVIGFTGCWCPTIEIKVDFISPVYSEDTIIATGKIISSGKSIIRTEGILHNKKTNKLIAKCSASFFIRTDN